MIRINNTQYFHFLQQADALRRSGLLCDAILTVKNQTFRAHRLVLACASRRLEQQLALGDTESPVQCTLDHFSPHTFQQVLDFTYTQTLEVSMDDLHLLLRAAELLEMQPLEDQCRKQLDNFHFTGRENRITEIIQVTEEKERAEQTDDYRREASGQEKLRDDSLLAKTGYSIVMGNNSPLGHQKNHMSPTSPTKKSIVSPESAAPYSRESGLTSPAGSSSPFSSPWTFPNMWSSVSTLRRIAQNYSNLVASYPRQHSNQSSAAYPFPLTNPQMFPLLGSHFQSPVMSYTGSHPVHTPNLYVGSTGRGSKIKQGLLNRKRQSQRLFNTTVQSSEPSCHDVSKADRGRLKRCQHCSTSIVDDPVPQESVSKGEACAGYQFSLIDAARHYPKSCQQEQRGGKPFQCQSCPKRFSLKHQLDTHHRVHTGEKPFECRICGQRSRDYSAMIKHLRTHGGAAPYQCTVCLEFCSSLVAMQRHIKSHNERDFPPDWSINSTYLYTSQI